MRLVTGLFFAAIAVIGHDAKPVELSSSNGTRLRYSYDAKEWDEAAARAKAFASQLTQQEKILMVTGDLTSTRGCVGNINPVPRLGFNGLCLQDGPQAVNPADGISVFPSGASIGASWDRDLIYQRGFALGSEFRDKGINVMLGPVAGPLGRSPLGGRNWEGFAADPYLSGIAMGLTIQGAQTAGVQTCSKHYIANEQETQRTQTTLPDGTVVEAVSSNLDDRTLHEMYLWPFANAVKAGATSFMCAYNRVNQSYACANDHILNRVLREELGFRGYVVSDWFATHGTSDSANSGLDMEMPGNSGPASAGAPPVFFGQKLLEAVEAGNVTQARLDDMITAIMTPYYVLKQDSADYPSTDPSLRYSFLVHGVGWNNPALASSPAGLNSSAIPAARDVRGDHAATIRKMGAAGTVLLKNEGSILPFRHGELKNIGVFGNDAIAPTDGLTQLVNLVDTTAPIGFEYGTLDIGGGSGTGRHVNIVAPLDAIKARAGAKVQYLASNDLIARNEFRPIFPKPEVCIVFLKSWASEGNDRVSFEADWNSTLVVNNVADFCNNTVVVVHAGVAVSMPWADHPNVKAILAAHLPGEETGNAIVDVLWGDVEPSGRLPYTIPKEDADFDIPVANFTGQDVGRYGWQANFTEGLMIDYRHFDALNIEPRYEFGFGLGYATFEVDGELTVTKAARNNCSLSALPNPHLTTAPGGNPSLWETLLTAHVTVKNTGEVAGAVVPQLYLSYPAESVPQGTPVRVLRGFAKEVLQPKESTEIEFPLMRRDLSYWDTEAQAWRLPEGEFTLHVGFSSRNLKLDAKVALL